ncbi:hypothetical protein BWD42_05360 [Sphingobacterium sp. CZ-UAM]|uniref:EF-Tu C-terminal domain-related protein n=1 Tax=Sphingobacterium sp. CZ-UAM TaxID=1933868 RepID=UPI000986E0D2|nr:hypothetical protein [Sphingobacterium sp. CZ-UAM]OOG19363.1 hypothetical protein BWD42_05360 [Sphingobacterium sp. CZ-UAM]
MSDFIAQLQYRTTQEGGRKTPAFSKYRPQIKFDFDEMQTSGEQTFIDKDTVYPGDQVKAVIRLAGVIYFKGKLAEGILFEFREGSRVIGIGKILQILNDTLKVDR